jgi:uncharacterized cupredoxin-like copper-binding protein
MLRRNGGWLAAAAALSLALAGAAIAGIVVHHGGAASRVLVVLREYRITLDHRTVAAGKTTFVVANRGKIVHAFAIGGPGIGRRRIRGTIAPGRSRTLTVTLGAGSYRVWCPIPGHAALGMKTTLVATGAAAGGSGATTTDLTTTGGGGKEWG